MPEFSRQGPATAGAPVYRFGVPPDRSARALWERYGSLAAELSARGGFELRLESAQQYPRYCEKLRAAAFDVAIVETHQVLDAERRGYVVLAKTGPEDRVSGILLVRRDAGIRRLADLRRRRVALGSGRALAPAMLVRSLLHQQVPSSWVLVQTAAEESAVLQALWGRADAAGCSRRTWEAFQRSRPAAALTLEPRWHTESLSGPALMIHRRVPEAHRHELAREVRNLPRTPSGLRAIASTGFHALRPAEPAAYDDVWEFSAAYERQLRSTDGGAQ